MAIDPETEFGRELVIFGDEVEEAIQCFYVWLTVHGAARKNQKVYDLLNRDAAFWNLALRALQANSLIVLGRIFDTDKRSHGVDRLLRLAGMNMEIFSTAALKRRKSQQANADAWLDDFMRDGVYVPTAIDFKRLQSYVDTRRKVYESSYQKLRNRVFAHKSRVDVTGFVAKTNICELGRLLSSMDRLHDVLWDLLNNGRKPTLRPVRHSARRRIERETSKFLKSLVG